MFEMLIHITMKVLNLYTEKDNSCRNVMFTLSISPHKRLICIPKNKAFEMECVDCRYRHADS